MVSRNGRRLPLAAASAVVALALDSGAFAAGDAAKGKMVAEEFCNSCHVVKQHEPGLEAEVAPRFKTMRTYPASRIRAALKRPHPFMPKFGNLTDQDMENIAAYIHTLTAAGE